MLPQFTSRAGSPSSSRYIEVFRGDIYISRHSDIMEAVEAAFADASAIAADTEYEFRYPNKMLLIKRSGYITTTAPPATTPIISSVNGGNNPYNNQDIVVITGSNFGGLQQTVEYGGYPIVILSWADTQIQVAWPDIPFDSNYASFDFNLSANLSVYNGTVNANKSVVTVPAPAASYAVITSIPESSIYSDDSGIALGVDKGYIRINVGAADTIDAATGVLTGVDPGTEVEYTIFDVSANSWVI